MDCRELSADGLLLDLPTLADLDRVVANCQDADVLRYTTVPRPYRTADGQSFLADFVPSGWRDETELTWAIREAGDPLLRGTLSLRKTAPGSVEIGYLVAPDSRGRHLARRACMAAIDFAFAADGLSARRVVWHAVVGNWPSWRTAWSCGFRLEGAIRSELSQGEEWQDSWVATLLHTDPRVPATPWPGEAAIWSAGLFPEADKLTATQSRSV